MWTDRLPRESNRLYQQTNITESKTIRGLLDEKSSSAKNLLPEFPIFCKKSHSDFPYSIYSTTMKQGETDAKPLNLCLAFTFNGTNTQFENTRKM